MKQWVVGVLGAAVVMAGYAAPGSVSAQRVSLKQQNSHGLAESMLLPNPFPVYVGNGVVVNQPAPGMKRVGLPTFNSYQGGHGCYLACYSHDRNGAVYGVGGNIWVKGQLRVPGHYENRVCKPIGFEHVDISALDSYKDICGRLIPTCTGRSCWVGGDTGGWFGL